MNRHPRSSHKGFTVIELIIVVAIVAILAAVLVPLVWYDGERDVNGATVDCIGVFDDEPPLPEGFIWKIGANPILPSFFMFPPAGPIVVALTDIKCPEPVTVIPGATPKVLRKGRSLGTPGMPRATQDRPQRTPPRAAAASPTATPADGSVGSE